MCMVAVQQARAGLDQHAVRIAIHVRRKAKLPRQQQRRSRNVVAATPRRCPGRGSRGFIAANCRRRVNSQTSFYAARTRSRHQRARVSRKTAGGVAVSDYQVERIKPTCAARPHRRKDAAGVVGGWRERQKSIGAFDRRSFIGTAHARRRSCECRNPVTLRVAPKFVSNRETLGPPLRRCDDKK